MANTKVDKFLDIKGLETLIGNIKNKFVSKEGLNGYATESWVEKKKYLTEHQSLEDYYKKKDVYNKPEIDDLLENLKELILNSDDLNETIRILESVKEWVEQNGEDISKLFESINKKADKTEVAELEEKVDDKFEELERKDQELDGRITDLEIDITNKVDKDEITDMATQTWVRKQNYLTEHQSLDEYAKTNEVTNEINELKNKFIALTLDEYNDLGEDIDEEAFYFIIDDQDDIFEKVKMMEERLIELENFVDQFPTDNRAYGIINRFPKYLNMPGLDVDPRNPDKSQDSNNNVTEELE